MAPLESQGSHLSPSYHFRHRRLSLESAFSEISELTMLPQDAPGPVLMRSISNASDVSKYSIQSSQSTTGPVSLRQKLRNLYDENYGALLVLLSQLFGALMNVFTRLLEHEGPHGPAMHPFQILFARQSLTALFCTVYAISTGSIPHFPLGPPDRKVRLLLMCRGFAGFFGVFGLYFSLLYMPLSEATVLTFLAPILTCYLCSYLIPGETFSRQQQMAGFVSLLGVVFIAQPFSFFGPSISPDMSTAEDVSGTVSLIVANTTLAGAGNGAAFVEAPPTPSEHLLAIGIAMVGVVGATVAITSIRAIGTRAHALISVNYFSTWCSILCLIALLVFPSVSFRFPANVSEWVYLISLGTCGFIMQGLLTMGLAYKATGQGGGSGQPKVEIYNSGEESDARRHDSDRPTKGVAEVEDIEMQDQDRAVGDFDAIASPSSAQVDERERNFSSVTNHRLPRQRRRKSTVTPSSSGTRATSMLYTQMLFALAGDRMVFGATPGLWSWIGIAFVLTGAIWVASARDKPTTNPSKEGIQTGSGHVDTYFNQHISGSAGKKIDESQGLLSHGNAAESSDSEDDEAQARTSSAAIPGQMSLSTNHHTA